MYPVLADIKAYLGIESDNEGDDTLLTTLLGAAIAFAEGPAGAGRVFQAPEEPTARTFDACTDVDGRRLFLDQDLAELVSVTNGDGAAVLVDTYTTLPRSETPLYALELKRSSGIVWQNDADGDPAIVVSGRWGYSLAPPADIVQAVTRLTAVLYRQKDNAQDIGQPMMSKDGAVIMPNAVPKDVLAVLKAYRSLS